MENIKKYSITICGDQYSLMSDEPEETITNAAALVDATMQEIAQHSKISDIKKIAVLAALRIACKATEFESDLDAIRRQKEKLIDHIDQELFSV